MTNFQEVGERLTVHKFETKRAIGGLGWMCTACDWRANMMVGEERALALFRLYHYEAYADNSETEIHADDIDQSGSYTERPIDDPVNHPIHYTVHPSGVECITITEWMGFNLGNAVKYIWRADEKGDALQDLEKAKWYLEREIQRRKKTQTDD